MTEVVNLTFHGIGDPPRALDPGEAQVWVTRERFEEMLDVIAGRGDVHVTFDDGNVSDLEIGLPALMKRGIQAEFYILAGRFETPGFLSRAQVRSLAEAGMKIGVHGMHHRPWAMLAEPALEEEIVTARKVLEELMGHAITTATCPFGSYNRRCLDKLAAAGYTRVYTSDRGVARRETWLQARNTLKMGDSAETLRAILAERGTVRKWIRDAKMWAKGRT